MKIIFLDIDGVLNTRRGYSQRPKGWRLGDVGEFHKPVQEMFEQFLTRHSDVDIVLSSTWRLSRDPFHVPLGWKFRIGKESPLILERIIDKTPSIAGPRGGEIKSWLSRHPEVTQYAIIDDDSDMLPEQLPHFVHTTFELGLTKAHIQKLEELL